MKSEGLYRVSGFSEHIEDVRLSFDRGLFTPEFCAPKGAPSLRFLFTGSYFKREACVSCTTVKK